MSSRSESAAVPVRSLVVCARAPWQRRRGDQLRAHQFAEALSGLGPVDLLVPSDRSGPCARSGVEAGGFGSVRRVFGYRRSAAERFWGLITAWPRGRALQQGLYRSRDLQRRVHALAADYDLIVVQLVRLSALLDAQLDCALAFDLIDSLALNYEGRVRRSSGVFGWALRPVLRHEARLLSRQEAKLCARVPVSVVAERDGRRLREQVPDARVEVLRLPLAPSSSGRPPGGGDGDREAEATFDVAFTGNLGYWVNRDALRWWLTEVWPALLERRPDATLLVAGSRTDRSIRSWCRAPGVVLRENPADLRAEIRRARVAVAPLRGGAGVPVKVLEAMAEGVAVVASPWACQGLDVCDPPTLSIADGSRQWCDRVIELLDDPAGRIAQVDRARAFVADRHGVAGCSEAVQRWARKCVEEQG